MQIPGAVAPLVEHRNRVAAAVGDVGHVEAEADQFRIGPLQQGIDLEVGLQVAAHVGMRRAFHAVILIDHFGKGIDIVCGLLPLRFVERILLADTAGALGAVVHLKKHVRQHDVFAAQS